MVPGGGRANATEQGADNLITAKCFLSINQTNMIKDTFRDMILKLHVSQMD